MVNTFAVCTSMSHSQKNFRTPDQMIARVFQLLNFTAKMCPRRGGGGINGRLFLYLMFSYSSFNSKQQNINAELAMLT